MRKELFKKCCPKEWNVRVFDEDDFWFYCGLGGIMVVNAQMERCGFHVKRRGHNAIFVSDKLKPSPERLYVLLHELAHFWLHPPGIQFFSDYDSIVEREAHAVAACAMIPFPVLSRFSSTEIAEIYGYPSDLIEFRRDLFDVWKF